MANLDLTCIECKRDFFIKENEVAFFKEKGFQIPKRCYNCRKARKARKEASSGVVAPVINWDDEGDR